MRGTPRPVQVEAILRSYDGVKQREHEDDDNEVFRSMRDIRGVPREGFQRGWAHFMEQRLGKTPVDLNEFMLFRRDHGVDWHIVVSPNSFKPEWVDEAERWGVDVPFHEFISTERGKADRFYNKNKLGGGMVINYEALRSGETMGFLRMIAADHRTMITFDECINAKNPQADQFKMGLELSKECFIRRDLTGKPVTQGPHDLWAQLRLIGALDGFNFYAFRNTFCKMGGFQGKTVRGSKNEEDLQEILEAWAFSARRVNWMRTPGRDYAERRLDMLPEQRAHYKRMHEDLITFLTPLNAHPDDDDIVIPADQIITKMLKLQQISSGFIIDEEGKPHDIMPLSKNPKVVELKRMLTDEIPGKTIILCHYTHTIEMLVEALAEFGPALIAGEAQMRRLGRDVQTEKKRFNGDPACRVVIGQEKAIKYGHTLMGHPDDPCLTEIFAENSYSLDDRAQCEERPQGAGQMGTITIWDFMASPIEAATLEALRRKEDVSAAVMGYARATGLLPH